MTVELKPIVIEKDDEILLLVNDIKRSQELIKTIEKQQKLMEQKLFNYMNEQEELQTVDEDTGEVKTILTWKTSKDSKSFDAKRFQTEHEALYKSYIITRPGSKRLLIK